MGSYVAIQLQRFVKEEDPVVNGDGAPDWVPDDEVVECGTSKCSFKIQKGSNHLSSFHQHDLSTMFQEGKN